MKKLVIAATAVVVLVVLALVAAPHVRAQARQPALPDVTTLPGLGSSIGASIRDLTGDESQKLKAAEGAYIDDVRDGTPAAKAGLKRGDVVVEFDGEKIRSARQLTRVVRETPPERAVKMTVVRDGSRRTLDVTPDSRSLARIDIPDVGREVDRALQNLPRNFSFDFDIDNLPGVAGRARLGATLMSINDQLSTYFGVKNGVLVSAVTEDTPAARAGLKAGDVITAVNGHMVDRPNDVTQAMRDLGADGGTLDMKVTRDRKEMSIQVPIAARERPRVRGDRVPV